MHTKTRQHTQEDDQEELVAINSARASSEERSVQDVKACLIFQSRVLVNHETVSLEVRLISGEVVDRNREAH